MPREEAEEREKGPFIQHFLPLHSQGWGCTLAGIFGDSSAIIRSSPHQPGFKVLTLGYHTGTDKMGIHQPRAPRCALRSLLHNALAPAAGSGVASRRLVARPLGKGGLPQRAACVNHGIYLQGGGVWRAGGGGAGPAGVGAACPPSPRTQELQEPLAQHREGARGRAVQLGAGSSGYDKGLGARTPGFNSCLYLYPQVRQCRASVSPLI